MAKALDLSAEVLLDQAGLLRDLRSPGPKEGEPLTGSVEAAIQADKRLSAAQKRALLTVYQSYISEGSSGDR